MARWLKVTCICLMPTLSAGPSLIMSTSQPDNQQPVAYYHLKLLNMGRIRLATYNNMEYYEHVASNLIKKDGTRM